MMPKIGLQPLEPELYFYRTAACLEVDFLLASERGIIPIETKPSERVSSSDGRSVETFLAEHSKAAQVGLVVYPGDEVVELRRNVWGIPDWYLVPIRKRPFRPIAALLSRRKMLTYPMYAEFMPRQGYFFVSIAPCTRTKLLVSG